MSDLLKLAEAYYTVCADMRQKAEAWLYQAELLSQVADRICEENMRQIPLSMPGPSDSASEQQETK